MAAMKLYTFRGPAGLVPPGAKTGAYIRTHLGKPPETSVNWASALIGAFLTALPIILMMAKQNRKLRKQLEQVQGSLL